MLRRTMRVTWVELPSGTSNVATRSILSPFFSVPASNWFLFPATAMARCTPVSWARMPRCDGVEKRRVETCSPA